MEETGLARNVSLLRKALGDEGAESRYIETIPKRGYRFLAEEAPADARAVRRAARRLGIVLLILFALGLFVYWQFYRSPRYVAASPGAPRMAVIPFECTGGALCASFFARPFEDLLAAEISRSGRVRLLSPSTVHRYRDNSIPTALMARLLGLEVVLEGSVSVLGPQVRVIARLSDVHSGRLVWSESYDLPAGDPAMAQRMAAQAIAGSLREALSFSGRE